jgi:MFS family permease
LIQHVVGQIASYAFAAEAVVLAAADALDIAEATVVNGVPDYDAVHEDALLSDQAQASGVGGAAGSFAMLVGARTAQGGFGVFGAISGAGAATGLFIGGVLTQEFSWRLTLFVNRERRPSLKRPPTPRAR